VSQTPRGVTVPCSTRYGPLEWPRRRAKYCDNGGMAFALSVEIGGDDDRPVSPPLPSPSRSYKSLQIDLNLAQGAGVALLWGRRSAALVAPQPQKYCHNGAWPSATPRRASRGGVPARGVCDRHLVPIVVRKKVLICRGNAAEFGGPCPWGQRYRLP